MGILRDALTAAKPGTHVRITQLNGNVLDGIVLENDGTEALSLRISATAVLRYEGIVGIETALIQEDPVSPDAGKPSAEPVKPQSAPVAPAKSQPAEPPAPKTAALFPPEDSVTVQKLTGTLTALKSARSLLLREQQAAATPIYDKYQSYLNSKDAGKLREVITLSWNLMADRGWDYDPNYNRFHAYLLLTGRDYGDAADSFFFADETMNACRCAYQGAATTKDSELYAAAGALASVILMNRDAMDDYAEAAEILKQSALACMDISFVTRILESGSSMAKQYLARILWYLCGACDKPLQNPDNTDESLAQLQPYFSHTDIAEKISERLGENQSGGDDGDAEEDDVPAAPEKTITAKRLEGYILSYNPSSGEGMLRGSGSKKYPFREADIMEGSLLDKLRSYKGAAFDEFPAEFVIHESSDGSVTVVSVKRKKGWVEPVKFAAPDALAGTSKIHSLLEAKRYDEVIAIGQEQLRNGEIDNGCFLIFTASLSLLRQNPNDVHTLNDLRSLADEYAPKMTETVKNLELLRQVHRRLERIPEQLEVLNRLMALSTESDHSRLLHYLSLKAECYTKSGDFRSAAAQWEDYLLLLQKHPETNNADKQTQYARNELTKMYLLLEDYKNARKYAEKLADPSQRAAALARIPAEPAPETPLPPASETDETSEESDDLSSAVPLSEYYEDYLSSETYRLTQSETEIFDTVAEFPADRLYALLTWLTSVSDILSQAEEGQQTSRISMKYTAAETVSSVEKLFSYAFRNPLSYHKDFPAELPELLTCAAKCVPDIADRLFAAASMRALFHYSDQISLYQYEKLCELAADNGALTAQFPQLPLLLDLLLDFRRKTDYSVNFFAKYRTNHDTLLRAVAGAQKCLDEILKRMDGYENMGRARKTREILFGDTDGIFRTGLDLVLNNRISAAAKLKEELTVQFMRSGRPFGYDSVDAKKIDAIIDDAWDEAKRRLNREGHAVSNPNNNLTGERRTNITMSIHRILSCLCDWIEAAENSAEAENPYAKKLHDETVPRIEAALNAIAASCTGTDWGTEAVRHVANELLAKLDGSFDPASRKYFFLDFLRSGDVLLDENYLPARNSTFCDLPAFTLPERIRRHAARTLPSLEDRLSEIFEDDASRNNFRSAQLIRDYGEDTGRTSLSEHELLRYYDKCVTSGRKRLEAQFDDFAAELELCEQYGSLSDVAGEKTRILRTITTWYRICSRTEDYGFYINILDAYRATIADAAQKHGEQLLRQLEELESDGSYDFGVYPPEKIRGYIEDQNFTVAENMLNCIRRHDVAVVADYAEEPFGYLNGFIGEAAVNHRASADMSGSLEQSVLKYTQKKDLEKALRQFTNTAMKDIKGGINLISTWIHRASTAERIAKLLNLLGMPGCTVAKDETSKRETFLAKAPLRTGKVTYPHPIPAFGSLAEQEEFRILCLYGSFDCGRLLDVFKEVNTTAKHTLVFLDYPLNIEERRKLARKLKEEKSFAKSFLVIDRVLLFYLARHYAANTVSRMLMAAAMPFAYYQPFVEDSRNVMPPELFTGREDALVSIEQPDGANLVYGGRQLGKSALLKMAKHNIDGNANGDRAVLVEIKSLNYAAAAKEVSYRLIVENILPAGSETDDWEVLTRHIETRLRSNSPSRLNYLLLMLDEADDFIKSCREVDHRPIALLKNLMPGRFKIVMAGLHDLSRFNRDIALHGNSLIAHLGSINIKPFERPEAVKLLTNTLAYLGLRFKEESVISLILAKTNYFPGLIQLYCQKLLETMRNSDYAGYGQYNTPPYEITESHFKKVLTDRDFAAQIHNKLEMTLFVEEVGHSHYHIIALLLSYLHTASPSENGHTPEEVYALAEKEDIQRLTSLKPEQIRELMNEMWDLNILTAKDEHYVFATEGFREMLGDQNAIRNKIIEYFAEGLS